MRIALLSHQWPGARMGGIGSAVRHTAAALAGAGHDVHVFTLTLPADARANVPAGVHLHETPALAERVAGGQLPAELAATINAGGEAIYRLSIGWLLGNALLEEHRQQPFDIVEAPEVEALGLPLLLDDGFAAPVVTHLHCATAIAHLGNGTPVSDADRLIHAMEFAAIALAHGVCAPAQKVVELTRQFMRIEHDVAIIPHPVASDAAPTGGSGADNGDEARPILFFGRIERLKGVETIAHALNLFLPRNRTATFRFIGPDTNTAPERRSMQQHLQRIIRPDLHARVEFPGEMNHAQLRRELDRCSFCVLPSLWENFSMAVCEALSAGKAVIVGEGTGSPEVIGHAGLVAHRNDPSDLAGKMERLHRDGSLRQTIGQRARERIATEFAPGHVADRRVAFYEQTITRARESGRPAVAQALAALPAEAQAAFLRSLVAITGAMAGVAAVRTPGARLLTIMQRVTETTGQPAHVVLYGAGKHTQRLLSERALWERHGHRVVGLIDDHPRFAESPVFLDLPVRSVAAASRAIAAGESHPPVVLSTDTYQDAFWLQTAPLRKQGVAVFRLYE